MIGTKLANSDKKQESSGVGARKSPIQKLTSFGYREAPNLGFQNPESPRVDVNYNTLGKGITLQNSLRKDSKLGLTQQRKSGQPD
jgi:hypothetical protein